MSYSGRDYRYYRSGGSGGSYSGYSNTILDSEYS